MLSRRELLALGLSSLPSTAATPNKTHQATGLKVGELTPHSVRFWLRRTASSQRLSNGIVRRGQGPQAKHLDPNTSPNLLEGATPGAPGYTRIVCGKLRSPWLEVDPNSDFTIQHTLEALKPDTSYRYTVETRATRNGRIDGELTGSFRTLASPNATAPSTIALLSCQMYCHMDRPDGFHIYESIERLNPNFLLSCGDNVYYDNEDPIANTEALARYHWQRMYSLPTLVSCLSKIGGFWQKDDHDVLSDDAWPGMTPAKMAPLTFEQGQRIFRQQVPAPLATQPMYRTVRVNRHLELWLPESRDHRSPNNIPDGPSKSIWGEAQKRWLMSSLQSSDATFKILVNPNPIVGPDRKTKNDNHSNAGFATESLEFRRFLKNNFPGNVISVCGDRHWQYHSVDPESGLHEFGCGAASDEHAGGTPGLDPQLHKFHRVLGGFLKIQSTGAQLTLTHCDVKGQPLHAHTFTQKA